ncbi:hypothetical protein COT87_00020 [Candidatus Collierbacteria bacterium CG10_big_fil_rev_8_21_14_0_10_44_9]|uniref:LysM domain-containing protein n=1 Tax=Candidatus Collierbacteria bacterium CG10_big_fil_rev_8_21_14_0_10_44_9 TaxID=1974535 RepID=A0A2H0VJN7_9BACT|nr:MAG: hypothetical protein COT87_00020 [Candidatus Collierbacteria bacterium CG10_big_fil_rev_8_21_14_0_10_44_9]
METKLKQLLKTIKLNESMLSMIFGVVTVLLIGILIMRMYSVNKPTITTEAEKTEIATEKVGNVSVETKEDGKKYPLNLADKVTVTKGDSLWKIAEKAYGSGYNWVDIAKENKLINAGKIEIGQELNLPKVAIKEVVKNIQVADKDAITGNSYTVIKGDYLWSIAVRAYGDGYKWVDIAKDNNIDLKHANYIEIGLVLKLAR